MLPLYLKMEKLTLNVLSVLFCFFTFRFCASSEVPIKENKSRNGLVYFRISNDSANYIHEPTSSYHQLISERACLYTMLAAISNEIEALNPNEFEVRLIENKERIGFSARFHIFFLILNRYSRSDASGDVTPFTEMINSLSNLVINEIPNEIVLEQFKDFNIRVTKIITDFRTKGGRDLLLANELQTFLEA